jgi:hypothetical protein
MLEREISTDGINPPRRVCQSACSVLRKAPVHGLLLQPREREVGAEPEAGTPHPGGEGGATDGDDA